MNDPPKADAKASPRPSQIIAGATIATSSPDDDHRVETRSGTLAASPTMIIDTIPPRMSVAYRYGRGDDDRLVSYLDGSIVSTDDHHYRDDLGHVDDPTNHRADRTS